MAIAIFFRLAQRLACGMLLACAFAPSAPHAEEAAAAPQTGAAGVASSGGGPDRDEDEKVARIGISPSTYTIDLDGPQRTQAYRLQNFGKRPRRVRIGVINWTTDENSQVQALPPSADSLDQWVVVNPLELDIPGGESRAVRFSVRPAVPLPPGEHRAALVFEEVPHPSEAEEDALNRRHRVSLHGRFRITSAVYATVGAIERRGEVSDVGLVPNALLTRVASRGNGHVRWDARFQVWRHGAFPGLAAARALVPDASAEGLVARGDLTRTPVLPGTERTLRTPLDANLPAGRYTVAVFGSLGGETIEIERTIDLRGR